MTELDFAAKYRAGFTVSELGRIRALLPLSEMASAIAIRFPKRSPQGKKPMFSSEDEIAEIARFYGMPLDSLSEFTTKPTYKVNGKRN